MAKHGGKREGSGRKSKAEEYNLVEQLDNIIDPTYVIEKMFTHIQGGSEKMLELYMGYRFGKPKQQADITTNGDSIKQPPILIFGENDSQDE
jgi:hypothetical protein